jgi:hypothetical protein
MKINKIYQEICKSLSKGEVIEFRRKLIFACVPWKSW